MAKRLQEILEDVGMNRREARVYLAVLQSPEASLATITRKTLIPRMSCYPILQELLQKGFIDPIILKNRRYFIAVPPERILSRIERHASEFKESLSRFEKLRRGASLSPRVRFFEGVEGIRSVFRAILDEKRALLAITSLEDMGEVAEWYFDEFVRRRIKQNLPVRLLTNHTPFSVMTKNKDGKELRQTRFVGAEHAFHTAEYIFGNKVAILSLKQKPPTALIIEDEDIAKTHSLYFELIWKKAV